MTFTIEKQTVITLHLHRQAVHLLFSIHYPSILHLALNSQVTDHFLQRRQRQEELLVECYLQICHRGIQNITKNTWGQWKLWRGIQEFLHAFKWWSSSTVIRISVFGFLFKLSVVVWFSFLCFVFCVCRILFGFGIKAYLQQIPQNRLKCNTAVMQLSLFSITSHTSAISDPIILFQSIYSQNGCLFCSLHDGYDIKSGATYLYLW